MSDERLIVARALDGVERLMRLFLLERIVYLLGAIISLLLLTYASWLLVKTGATSPEQFALLFGSGGMFAVAGVQVTQYLNRAFTLLEHLQRPAPLKPETDQ